MKKLPKYIGLSGCHGAGKDTLCSMLVAMLGANHQRVYRVSLGDCVRRELANKLGLPLTEMTDRKSKEIYRPLTREYAELMRVLFGPDVWYKQAVHEANMLCPRHMVFSDIYNLTEYENVMAVGGVTIRIRKKGDEKAFQPPVIAAGVAFDHYVDNDGNLDALANQARILLECYGVHPHV